jgi:outer membrane protein OmpA-like peptidoglycan-associated protein
MTLRVLAAGFAVSLLLSPAAFAKDQTSQLVVAQADTDAAQYLSETRPLNSLSDQELRQRVRAGRQLIEGGSLAQEDRKKVRTALQAAAQELKSRGAAGKASEEGGADEPAASDTAGAEPDQSQKLKQQKTAGSSQAPESGNVSEFLADSQSLDSMDEKALRQKLRAGRNLMKDTSLPQPDRKKVRQVMQALQAELKKRSGQTGEAGQQSGEAQGQGSDQSGQGAAQVAGGATDYLADTRPLGQLSEVDLRQRMRAGRQLIKGGSLSQDDRGRVQQMVRAARLELAKRGKAGGNNAGDQSMDQTGASRNAAENQGNGGPVMNVVGDNSDAAKLDDLALRKRLRAARDSLQGGKLSPEETKALRQKLAADRNELRRRVANKVGNGQNGAGKQPNVDWLQDRREAKALNDRELEARLAFYRAQMSKGNMTPEQQAQFRLVLDRDRQEFRARALVLRDQRVRRLKSRVASKDLNIQININPPGAMLPPGAPPPPVWAAEADDQMIMTQLVRRPARQFDRRYTYEEITAEPELREAIPAVEIDTVTFGFNEDFVREEQMENLDRIGAILEEILAEHPQEVFLVEGHTDAVGDDAYNLDLSRRRAAAIKEALTQYYAIGPENLKTVGYGERYLKVETEEPEEENRRITIRRITPAIGELEG